MNLKQTLFLYAETPQKDNAAMVGKPWRVVDQGYGHVISEWDTEEQANNAMMARPDSKVIRNVQLDQTQSNRDAVLEHSQNNNPDIA